MYPRFNACEDATVIMHMNEAFAHKLPLHQNRYTNELVLEAHAEFRTALSKTLAAKTMRAHIRGSIKRKLTTKIFDMMRNSERGQKLP